MCSILSKNGNCRLILRAICIPLCVLHIEGCGNKRRSKWQAALASLGSYATARMADWLLQDIALVAEVCQVKLMTESENAVHQALIELEGAVKGMATANPKPDLRPLFARIEELARQLPADTHPDLLHYLRRQSYQKARLFLEGRDAENAIGSCGHV